MFEEERFFPSFKFLKLHVDNDFFVVVEIFNVSSLTLRKFSG